MTVVLSGFGLRNDDYVPHSFPSMLCCVVVFSSRSIVLKRNGMKGKSGRIWFFVVLSMNY